MATAGIETQPAQLLPEAQMPGLEALKVHSRYIPELFPAVYNAAGFSCSSGEPEAGSPLLPLFRSIHQYRDQADRIWQAGSHGHILLTDEQRELAERNTLAAGIQEVLLKSINNAHFDLVARGASPFETHEPLAGYIDDMDARLHHFHTRNIDSALGTIAALDRREEVKPTDEEVMRAFSSERTEKEKGLDSMPITPELEREAYLASMKTLLRKSRLHLERLQFEWVSSMFIVDAMKRSLATGEFIEAGRVQAAGA